MVPRRRNRDSRKDLWAAVTQGEALRNEFDATGNRARLDLSIQILEATAAAARGDPSTLSAAVGGLGLSLRERARITTGPSSVRDLAAAVAAHEEGYRLVPRDSEHWAGTAGNLAGTLRQRWQESGDIKDLDRALELYREAVKTLKPGHRYTPDAYTNLANGLRDRFDALGDRKDLDDAVTAAVGSVKLDAPGSPGLPRRLGIAAGLLRQHADFVGDRSEMKAAVELATRARDLTPVRHPGYASRLSTLSGALTNWYVMSGDLAALDQAVEAGRASFQRAAPDQEAGALVSLSAALLHRYNAYEQPENIVELAEVAEAVESVLDRQRASGTQHDAKLLEVFALLCRTMAEETFDPSAPNEATALLDDATAALTEARSVLRPGSPDYARVVVQLADVLYMRHRRFGADLTVLDEAIRLLEPVQATLRGWGTAWANASYVLSAALGNRGIITGSREDLQHAERLLAALAEADLPGFGATIAVSAAMGRGLVAAADGRDAAAADAFTEALDLTRAQFASQSTRRERAGALTKGQRLPALAATALIKDGRLTQAAVALETGQAMLASESMARATFDVARVAKVNGSLADRLRAAMDRLSQAEKLDVSDPASASPSPPGNAAVATARAEFNAVLNQVRALPGLADCLGPPVLADVLAGATDRPLVYLTVADRPRHGYALVFPAAASASDVVAVDLPALTEDALIAKLEQAGYLSAGRAAHDSDQQLQSFLDWLGQAAVQPWLDRIGGQVPSVRIVPTGWLTQCPLHAATVRGPRGTTSGPLIDWLAVSFAPNARAITLARNRAVARKGRRLLAVGDPQPTSAPPLPMARAEVRQIAAAYPNATVLLAEQATLARVRAELPSADVLHLACHGYAAPLRPEASAVVLSGDEKLTLSELTRSQVSARWVLLSACETAISGFSLPDEVVALPTSFLQAGAAGIIGSLWRVPDSSAAILMAEVHARLGAGTDPASALAQAQRWLRVATNKQLLARWPALLPSSGPESRLARELWLGGQPFAAPSNWAPFIFVGA